MKLHDYLEQMQVGDEFYLYGLRYRVASQPADGMMWVSPSNLRLPLGRTLTPFAIALLPNVEMGEQGP